MNFIYDYFSFPTADLNKQKIFSSSHNQISKPSIYSIENIDSYKLYNIKEPFRLSIIDYDSDHISHLFADMFTSVLGNNLENSHTSSQLHKHNFYEFFFLLDGQLDFIIEETHRRYYPGDACIINSNVKHVEKPDTKYTALYLNFKPDFLAQLNLYSQEKTFYTNDLFDFFKRNEQINRQVDYIDFSPVPSAVGETSSEIPLLLFHLVEELLCRKTGYQDIIYGYIKRLFSLLQKPSAYNCSNTKIQLSESQSLFERSLSYLNNNKRKVTRAELAEELHYNGTYISQVFQKHTGQTLAVYIRNNYLNESTNLLLNTDLSITEIIKELGFENRTAFYSQFKKKFGTTPQIYRDTVGKKM